MHAGCMMLPAAYKRDVKGMQVYILREGQPHHWQKATMATPTSNASTAKAAPAYCEV